MSLLESSERGPSFANARVMRKLFHSARVGQERRLDLLSHPDVADLRRLEPGDLPAIARPGVGYGSMGYL